MKDEGRDEGADCSSFILIIHPLISAAASIQALNCAAHKRVAVVDIARDSQPSRGIRLEVSFVPSTGARKLRFDPGYGFWHYAE